VAGESALVCLVPEAEALVGPWRDRHDPSAATGMPAHVTLLYPFKPPGTIDGAVLAGLRACFAGFASFRFTLAAIRRLESVLYLEPEPASPFRELTQAIWQRYPETPPYGGRHREIIPHLTVAEVDDGQLDAIAAGFAPAAKAMLPIGARATEVALMDNASGRWSVRTVFGLAS
jgi:2'-5' RNA ligase